MLRIPGNAPTAWSSLIEYKSGSSTAYDIAAMISWNDADHSDPIGCFAGTASGCTYDQDNKPTANNYAAGLVAPRRAVCRRVPSAMATPDAPSSSSSDDVREAECESERRIVT